MTSSKATFIGLHSRSSCAVQERSQGLLALATSMQQAIHQEFSLKLMLLPNQVSQNWINAPMHSSVQSALQKPLVNLQYIHWNKFL